MRLRHACSACLPRPVPESDGLNPFGRSAMTDRLSEPQVDDAGLSSRPLRETKDMSQSSRHIDLQNAAAGLWLAVLLVVGGWTLHGIAQGWRRDLCNRKGRSMREP